MLFFSFPFPPPPILQYFRGPGPVTDSRVSSARSLCWTALPSSLFFLTTRVVAEAAISTERIKRVVVRVRLYFFSSPLLLSYHRVAWRTVSGW